MATHYIIYVLSAPIFTLVAWFTLAIWQRCATNRKYIFSITSYIVLPIAIQPFQVQSGTYNYYTGIYNIYRRALLKAYSDDTIMYVRIYNFINGIWSIWLKNHFGEFSVWIFISYFYVSIRAPVYTIIIVYTS